MAAHSPVLRDVLGRLCYQLVGVPTPGLVQEIVVPAVTLDRYYSTRHIFFIQLDADSLYPFAC